MFSRSHNWLMIATLALLLAGCGGNKPNFKPETIKAIELGMTLQEVQDLVGARPTRGDRVDLNSSNERRRGILDSALNRPGVTVWVWQQSKALLVVSIDDKSKKVVGKAFSGGSR